MNASAPIRSSYVRNSVISLHNHRMSTFQGRRSGIVPLDYSAWKDACDHERRVTIYESSVFEEGPELPARPGTWVQIRRMFTIFPFRDMTWIVSVLVTIGSLDFTLNSFFGLLPFVAPATVFPTETTLASPATIVIGGSIFLFGGFLGIIASFNASRGTFHEDKDKIGAEVSTAYRPALIGDSNWVWFPLWDELKVLLSSVPFQAGLIQLLGGLILSVAVVASIPGVIDPNNTTLLNGLAIIPETVGFVMFLLGNLTLLIYVQDRWYKPKLLDATWQSAFWSTFASVMFVAGGLLMLGQMLFLSIIMSFIGSWCFLIGSLIQWYTIMEFYPE